MFVDEQVGGAQGVSVVVVSGWSDAALTPPGALPVVVVCVGDITGGHGPDAADVVLAEADLDAALVAVQRSPLAATALAVLLRHTPAGEVEAGLALESAVYSTLQAGPEFASWRAAATYRPATDDEPTVQIERDGSSLTLRLHRPQRHNAISTRMRDELTAGLQLALIDDSITEVHLCGGGPSFCSGGDLGEFGDRSDPASAHHTRLARSPARLIHRLRTRTVAHVHGAAMGGGIEMAAFAGRVVAHPDTRIALPELGLGLIPGAGGTVSITRRIGRQRTALLALSTNPIDARTALAWGLVDDID